MRSDAPCEFAASSPQARVPDRKLRESPRIIWLASVLVSSLNVLNVAAQDCSKPAPCLNLTALQQTPLVTGDSAQMFAASDDACGGPDSSRGVITSVMLSCISEATVPNGCPCAAVQDLNSPCKTAIDAVSQECLQSLNSVLCAASPSIEENFGQNVRGLFHHITNDCGGYSFTCPELEPFDPMVCGAPAPLKPVAASDDDSVAGAAEDLPNADAATQEPPPDTTAAAHPAIASVHSLAMTMTATAVFFYAFLCS